MVLEFLEHYWDALVMMTAEMAPYLLLGFLIAGLLRVFVPRSLYAKHLAPNNMKSVVKAAAIGVPLPLCSCGVIPTTVGLRKEGASHGACTSFLIATPQTGVDSIIATYSLMGLPFAIVRPLAALFTAMFGGWLVSRRKTDGHHGHGQEGERGTTDPSHQGGEACGEHHHEDEVECGCGHHHHEDEVECGCGHHHHHEEEVECGCGHHHHHEGHEAEGVWCKIKGALDYAFVDMMQDVGKWLVVGLLIAALISVVVPNEWLAALHDYKLLNMLIVLAVAIPMYVCATGSIPIAVSLMAKGLTPGAALVLLMAGPAVNSASMLVIGKVFGRRTLTLYLVAIIVGAIAFGLGIDYLLPQEWFAVQSGIADLGGHCAHSLSVWDWVWIVLLVGLLVNAFWEAHRKTDGHGGCGCGHHHDHEQTSSLPDGRGSGVELPSAGLPGEGLPSAGLPGEGLPSAGLPGEGLPEVGQPEVGHYRISGMSCNHCKANVERAIRSVEGVEDVEVNLARGEAVVRGKHDPAELIEKVKSYGYEVEEEK
ncbi:MAG: SO_0444 family Cu/Zn efflux transporter [Bacteroidaceae bacterium]|nr:SO_0444 family Cu/Zn efflux transporter [Bacteroidaceae bacterium]